MQSFKATEETAEYKRLYFCVNVKIPNNTLQWSPLGCLQIVTSTCTQLIDGDDQFKEVVSESTRRVWILTDCEADAGTEHEKITCYLGEGGE